LKVLLALSVILVVGCTPGVVKEKIQLGQARSREVISRIDQITHDELKAFILAEGQLWDALAGATQ